MNEEKGIWIIQETDNSKALGDYGADYGDSSDNNRPGFISVSQLKQNIGEFLEVIKEAFNQAENSTNDTEQIQLSELECSIEINGKGQIGLLGTGGEGGAKGAIKLKFTRKDG